MLKSKQLESFYLPIIIVLFWLLAHPYSGIYHDATLYAGQALSHIYPENFANDIFFNKGSQDNFTIFSSFYAFFIKIIGLNHATLFLTSVGILFWLFAFYLVCTQLLNKESQWLALILISLISRYYGFDVFRYAEPFLTSRLYAEAFILLGLSYMLKEKIRLSLLYFFLGLFFHPIMAFSGLPILYLYQFHTPKRTLLLSITGIISLFLLNLSGIEIIQRLFNVMDTEWANIVRNRASYMIFIDEWSDYDWKKVLLISSTYLMIGIKKNSYYRLYFIIFLIASLSFLLSAISSIYYNNVLILQAQIWRILWLAQVFSIIYFAWFIEQYWHSNKIAQIIVFIIISAMLTLKTNGAFISPLVPLLAWLDNKYPNIKSTQLINLIWYSSLFLTAISVILFFASEYQGYILEILLNVSQEKEFFNFFKDAILKFSACFFIYYCLYIKNNSSNHTNLIFFIFFIILIPLTITGYMEISNHEDSFYQLKQPDNLTQLETIIPKNAVLYWENNHANLAWFLLKRSHYISILQTTGMIFSRDRAIEALRRTQTIRELGIFSDGIESMYRDSSNKLSSINLPSLSEQGIEKACQDPILDFLILSKKLKKEALLFSVNKNNHIKEFYYLYDCRRMRNHETKN